MTLTYVDFEWLVEDYPWVDNSFHVTYVHNADSQTVIDALTWEDLGTATGLTALNERYWDYSSVIGATQIGGWTVAIAPQATAGLREDLTLPLSIDREVLTHSKDIEALCSLTLWKDGVRTAYFDPLLRCGAGLDPMPKEWRPRLSEVGIDPDGEGPTPDGLFYVLEASLAMAANYTGVALTPDVLRSAEFLLGNGRD